MTKWFAIVIFLLGLGVGAPTVPVQPPVHVEHEAAAIIYPVESEQLTPKRPTYRVIPAMEWPTVSQPVSAPQRTRSSRAPPPA